jgi:hypothetical protein
MPELVTIPISLVEIIIEYQRPNMKLLVDRAKVVDQLFEVFSAWNVKVDDVEVISEGKPSDQGTKFKIPTKRTSFMFGAGSCKLNKDDANWETAPETIRILDSGWRVLSELGNVMPGAFKTAIAMHLQPKTSKFIDLLKPFAPAQIIRLDPSPIKAAASVVKWDKRRVTLDGSSQLANGLFIRLEREFENSSTYEQMVTQLRADENELFGLLDIQEDLP